MLELLYNRIIFSIYFSLININEYLINIECICNVMNEYVMNKWIFTSVAVSNK